MLNGLEQKNGPVPARRQRDFPARIPAGRVVEVEVEIEKSDVARVQTLSEFRGHSQADQVDPETPVIIVAEQGNPAARKRPDVQNMVPRLQ